MPRIICLFTSKALVLLVPRIKTTSLCLIISSCFCTIVSGRTEYRSRPSFLMPSCNETWRRETISGMQRFFRENNKASSCELLLPPPLVLSPHCRLSRKHEELYSVAEEKKTFKEKRDIYLRGLMQQKWNFFLPGQFSFHLSPSSNLLYTPICQPMQGNSKPSILQFFKQEKSANLPFLK